ncbi:MAG TPA: class I SAM-dependent methyltransferase [Candidatus Sulfotelmatobacter sp.]|jgi:SAM-dependent methyltransferase|nr:class I SAM-dependent methyltransferase [Candidatus Sulfotelmatobacter sp.]
MNTIAIVPEIDSLKARLKTTWMAGDYDRFSRYMEQGARIFYEQLDVPPGCQLLDVACGSGQVALWAARDGVDVTGVDIAPNLIQRARARARAEGLKARFIEGDAEALPFEDGSFDVVTSLVGAMFAPRPELVARELLRVCSPGGTIAMGNWTPGGFIGQMFKTFAKFIAPSGMPAPVLWGDENVVRERLGPGVFSLVFRRRQYDFTYPFPPAEVVEFFRQYYGPTNQAFASLDETAASKLRTDLVELWSAHNRGGDEFTVVSSEYLEVIAVKA